MADAPPPHAELLKEAWDHVQAGRPEKAVALARNLVDKTPDDQTTSGVLFHALWALEDKAGAFEEARRFLLVTGLNPYKSIVDGYLDELAVQAETDTEGT